MTHSARPATDRATKRAAAGRLAAAGLLLGLALLPLPGDGVRAQDGARLGVLTVNGRPSTLNLVGDIIGALPEELRQRPLREYYDRIVDDIIDTQLAADAARSAGLAEDPLLAELARRASDRVMAEAWVNGEIRGRITEARIERRYRDLLSDVESREEVHARHILVGTREEAEDLIRRLGEGEDFAALAGELSIGPSGPNGGDLGWFGRGAMVPVFEAAAFALAKGEVGQTPAETQFGWHVIKVEDRRTAPVPELEEVRERIYHAISLEEAGEIMARLRRTADITRLSYEEMRAASGQNSGQDTAPDAQ